MSKRNEVSCGTCADDERAELRLLGIVMAVALGIAVFSLASLTSASPVVAGTTSGAAVTAMAERQAVKMLAPRLAEYAEVERTRRAAGRQFQADPAAAIPADAQTLAAALDFFVRNSVSAPLAMP